MSLNSRTSDKQLHLLQQIYSIQVLRLNTIDTHTHKKKILWWWRLIQIHEIPSEFKGSNRFHVQVKHESFSKYKYRTQSTSHI